MYRVRFQLFCNYVLLVIAAFFLILIVVIMYHFFVLKDDQKLVFSGSYAQLQNHTLAKNWQSCRIINVVRS